MMDTDKTRRHLMYIDNSGLINLYEQIVTYHTNNRNEIGATATVINPLVPDTSNLSPKQKLQAILDVLSRLGEPSCFNHLGRAAAYASENKDAGVFVNIMSDFDAPQFCENGLRHINEAQYMLLTRGINLVTSYDEHDSYFKCHKIKIMMMASLAKFPGHGSWFRRTSNEGQIIRYRHGLRIPLTVFGLLFKCPDYHQIKPYAISI